MQKDSCRHTALTLVQSTFSLFTYDKKGEVNGLEEKEQWFAAYQCDECGAITQAPVSADDLEAAVDAPWLDEDTYMRRTEERLGGEIEYTALSFINGAAKARPQRNGKNGYR